MADIALENRLRDKIEAGAECILLLAHKLIRTPSTSPPGNVSAVALVAADQIRQLIPKGDISTIETGPGIINAVADAAESDSFFCDHFDTYPTGEIRRWTLDPFSGELSSHGKHVYGRGVPDMKGGIAASIIAAQALSSCKVGWSGEVVIALAGDEETMGKLGSAHLIKHVAEVG
ncbi:Succinyl-diaminopimelate desuccinylase [Beauveria bassiana]|uniref:Succinyl-diaminopimelate desuccinylase n=1 Tax=Beauveria bassiana TaxID=176275 RepID=A0A2N6NVR1_BEABA|nr:Succinyl-diaminopimelate desuccinylase [Beauveria bassiana]